MIRFSPHTLTVLLALLLTHTATAEEKYTRLPVPDDAVDGKPLFYGAYMTGAKIGWYTEKGEIKMRGGKEVICLQSATHTEARSFGKEVKSVETDESWFEVEPPHRFLGGRVKTEAGDLLRVMEVEKVKGGYKATITEAGKTTTRDWKLEDFQLADVTSPTVWIRNKPKVGDQIRTRSISIEDLEITTDVLTITEIPKEGDKGGTYTIGLNNSKHGDVGTISAKPDGTVSEFSIGGGAFLIKLEDEKSARRIEELDLDLFADNIVKIEEKLGPTKKIESLVLKITGPSAHKVPSGPNQSAKYDEKSETLTLSIGREHGIDSPAEGKELEEALEDTVAYPANDPDVIKLAKRAVKKAGSDKTEQVAELVKFVDRFIKDEMTADPLTVADIMEKKSGDCTEHALLFVTLARALGIPAREVSGIYYADELGGFGGHAWAEVALDGKWVPVDPAWSQPWTDAAHIRMYTHGLSDYSQQVVQLSGKLKIEIVSIKRKR